MFQVNKRSSDFWNRIKLPWQRCADLPSKCYVESAAELDGKVYVTISNSNYAFGNPLMYDSNKDQWSSLPSLPYARFSLVTVTYKKQLFAIGGIGDNDVISNEMVLWDEEYRKWTSLYPNMPTARYSSSSISHGSTVIVAGGVICRDPWTMTRAVEVLHFQEHDKSYWNVVEQLPHVVWDAIPLIVNDKLYIAVGCDKKIGTSTCNVVTASLPELLQSSNKNTSNGQVWYKLPDMPYSSQSINQYQGCLIIFSGDYKIEQPNTDKPVYQSVLLIHIFNHYTNTWDCVGEIPCEYLMGRSVHIRDNKILFMGGYTGTYDGSKDDDMVTTCLMLTLSPW